MDIGGVLNDAVGSSLPIDIATTGSINPIELTDEDNDRSADDDRMDTLLNDLRIMTTLPSAEDQDCKVEEKKDEEQVKDRKGTSLGGIFDDDGDTSNKSNILTDALQRRFGLLPLHYICFYNSYQSTSIVLRDLKREMRLSRWYVTGTYRDCVGMTPLHILACSNKQDIKVYKLLIDHYPQTLIIKDYWGEVPLFYVVRSTKAPDAVVNYVVTCYKSIYPKYIFDWARMAHNMTKNSTIPLSNIKRLIHVHHTNFAEQEYDMQSVVLELAIGDTSQSAFCCGTPIEIFKYLLQVSIETRLDVLNVRQWRDELERDVSTFPGKAIAREYAARVIYVKLDMYEVVKEATSVLELALWQKKINDDCAANNKGNAISQSREECRINCGAEIIIRGVLRYLLPLPSELPPIKLESRPLWYLDPSTYDCNSRE